MPLIPVRELLDRLSVSPVPLRALLTRLPERRGRDGEHDESHLEGLVAEFDVRTTAEESHAPAPTSSGSAAVGGAASR